MSFNTSDIKDKPAGKYIRPGINEDVKIGPIEGNSTPGKAPYIDIKFYPANGKVEDATRSRFYMSEKAAKKTLEKFNHLATKVVTKEEFDAVGSQSSTVEQYAQKLNALLSGKVVPRMKFVAEEYKNQSGDIKVRPQVGFVPFAEASKETPTALKFDLTSKYDNKKYATPDMEVTAGATDDLPF